MWLLREPRKTLWSQPGVPVPRGLHTLQVLHIYLSADTRLPAGGIWDHWNKQTCKQRSAYFSQHMQTCRHICRDKLLCKVIRALGNVEDVRKKGELNRLWWKSEWLWVKQGLTGLASVALINPVSIFKLGKTAWWTYVPVSYWKLSLLCGCHIGDTGTSGIMSECIAGIMKNYALKINKDEEKWSWLQTTQTV